VKKRCTELKQKAARCDCPLSVCLRPFTTVTDEITAAAEVGLRGLATKRGGGAGGKLTYVKRGEGSRRARPLAAAGALTLSPGRAFRKRRDPSAASHNAGVMRSRRSRADFPPASPAVIYHPSQQADRSEILSLTRLHPHRLPHFLANVDPSQTTGIFQRRPQIVSRIGLRFCLG